MVTAGEPYATLIAFNTGLPSGVVSYELFGNDGQQLLTSNFTAEDGSVSHLLVIPAEHNTCATPLFEGRRLAYHYQTATELVSKTLYYRVEKPLPVAATADGVRKKLGVEPHELENDDIDLLTAYTVLLEKDRSNLLPPILTAGNSDTLKVIHALEAQAALELLPTMQIKIAQRETGGTNEFQRFTRIDWEQIELGLRVHLARFEALIDPTLDLTGGSTFIFGKATPTPDPVTGS